MSTFRIFIKDSCWTIGGQGVSLLTSIIVSFILPKFCRTIWILAIFLALD